MFNDGSDDDDDDDDDAQVPCGQRVGGVRRVPQCDQDHIQGKLYVCMYVFMAEQYLLAMLLLQVISILNE